MHIMKSKSHHFIVMFSMPCVLDFRLIGGASKSSVFCFVPFCVAPGVYPREKKIGKGGDSGYLVVRYF